MNYKKIFAHGSKYVFTSLYNWTKRRNKLLNFWVSNKDALINNDLKKERLSSAIDTLYFRINTLTQLIEKIDNSQAGLNGDVENIEIDLSCHNENCTNKKAPKTLSVKIKKYVPGKHICKKCGTRLKSHEDIGIDKMLSEI